MGGSEAPGERVLKILLFYFFQATENIGRFCGMALALHKCVPLTGIFPESNLPRIDQEIKFCLLKWQSGNFDNNKAKVKYSLRKNFSTDFPELTLTAFIFRLIISSTDAVPCR